MKPWEWVATVGGIGHLPVAPGTAASLVALLPALLFSHPSPAWQALLLVSVTALGARASAETCRSSGTADPQMTVIDEWAGMWVALAWLYPDQVEIVAAFILFRLLDIVKPWPIYVLERLPGGLGVMGDDLAAGLLTNLLLRVGRLVL